jgi:hypothetical protein
MYVYIEKCEHAERNLLNKHIKILSGIIISMFKSFREKSYLLGYMIIIYGFCRFGYFCFNIAHAVLNNKERTVIDSNSITIVGEMHFNYTNLIFTISFSLLYSIVLILLGVFIIKKGNKKRKNNTIQ